MQHKHYKFYAFNEQIGEQLKDGVYITVLDCITEEQALVKAKEAIVRPLYRLTEVWECRTCDAQEEQLANQRYLTTLLGKHIKENE